MTKYSDEDKDNALAAFLANGCNYWKTARELNIPYPTLRGWVQKSEIVSTVLDKHKEAFQKTTWATLNGGMKSLKKLMTSKDLKVADIPKIVNAIEVLASKQALLNAQEPVQPHATPTHKKTQKISPDTQKLLKKQQSGEDTGTEGKTIPLMPDN